MISFNSNMVLFCSVTSLQLSVPCNLIYMFTVNKYWLMRVWCVSTVGIDYCIAGLIWFGQATAVLLMNFIVLLIK